MKISLLTIGDELLIGQVLNSNAQWMSQELTDLGIQVEQHLAVGDSFEAISKGLDHSLSGDALIIGGGLGPTHDDLTMEALSKYFKIPLEYDENWISQVQAYFAARNRVMSENNKKQGYLLKTAIRIDNDCGTAAGQHLTVKISNRTVEIFVVPGVPHEVKSMMSRYILPFLKTKSGGAKILKKSLLVTGVGESLMATRCDPFVKKVSALKNEGKEIGLAFLPSNILLKLRLQMTVHETQDETLFESLVQELKTYCGEDFYGFEPETLQSVVIQKLKEKKQTVAAAESCTGGLIAHYLTLVSGSSEVFRGSITAYQPEIKEKELGVPPSLIEKNGIVSEAVAKAMAEGIRKKWNTDYGVSSTGYIGPTGGDAFATVGTVWVAVSTPTQTVARMFNFENNRERNKERATQSALDLLRRQLS